MSMDIGSRFLFGGMFLYLYAIYSFDFSNPREINRIASYFFGFLGIWGILIKSSVSIQLEGYIRFNNVDSPFSRMHDLAKNLDRSIVILLIFFLFGIYSNHYYNITIEFRDRFFLGERDFISIGEVILNFGRGLGFYSPFHGDGNSSFLKHHFALGLIAFHPWLNLFGDRIALAWGHFAYSIITVITLLLAFQIEWKKFTTESLNKKYLNPVKWFIVWAFFIFVNLYFYRMLFSYHFEILAIAYFTLLLLTRNYGSLIITSLESNSKSTDYRNFIQKASLNTQSSNKLFRDINLKLIIIRLIEFIFLVLLITVKEDIAIYLSLYYVGEIIYKLIGRYHHWKLDCVFLFICSAYFLIGIPYLREITGNTSDENWYGIWGHWIIDKSTNSPNLINIIQGIISKPIEVILVLYEKSSTLWEISLGFGFLFLLSPRYFIYIVSILCIHFLSSRGWHNTFYNYYIYSLLPVLYFASLEGLRKLAELSQNKRGIALGFLVISLVLYRNSWDAGFPYSNANLPKTPAYYHSLNSQESLAQSAQQMKHMVMNSKSVASQFDLGVWVSPNSRLYPISESPRLPNGDYPEYILSNSKSGFSPYIDTVKISSWEKVWESNYGYRKISDFNDISVWRK